MQPSDETPQIEIRAASPYLDFLYSKHSAEQVDPPRIEIMAAEPDNGVADFFDHFWSSAQAGLKQADHSITHADHNILMGAMAIAVVLIIVILTYRSS
jgi:hypothetical protein